MPGISPIKKTALTILAVPVALSLLLYVNFGPAPQEALAMVGALDSPMDLRLAAMESMLKGDTERALSVYSTAIEAATRQYGANSMFLADLYYEAGNLASKQDLFDKAENYLSQAVKINPRMSMARMELAELQKRRQKPMEALEQIQSDLAAHPESVVARHQFVRWLATNGTNAQDGSIAHQESLRILAMNSISKSAKPKDEMLKAFQRPTGKPSAASQSQTEKSAEPAAPTKSVETEEPVAKIQPMMSLPTRPNIKKADEIKAEKAKEEARKKENEQRLKEEKEQHRREQRTREERDARERENRNREAKLAAAKAKSSKAKATASEPAKVESTAHTEKAKPAKEPVAAANSPDTSSAESDAKAEARSKKAAAKARPAQEVVPQVVPTLQPMPQAYYPPMPVFNTPNRGKPKAGFVPPPPPTAFPNVYGGGMMPGAPMVIQTPQPVVKKPKPKPAAAKKVEEPAKEPVEDKPPPMTAAPQEGDPDWMLDWADVKGKKKRPR